MKLLKPLVFPDDSVQGAAATVSAGAMTAYVGDGSDGALVVNAGQTFALDREYNYSSVTVKNGGVLVVGGFRLLVRGLLTTEAGALIHADGIASYAYSGGSIARCDTAADGGSSGAGKTINAITNALGGNGGNGGNGNDGTATTAGGNGGKASRPNLNLGSTQTLNVLATTQYFSSSGSGFFKGGGGGGAGGGSGTGGFGGGGAGATGAAVVCVNAQTIVHNGLAAARGGGGGNRGGTGVSGGGGGGGGGVVIFNSNVYSGNGIFDASGGQGGSGQNGGTAGQNGSPGQVFNNVWS